MAINTLDGALSNMIEDLDNTKNNIDNLSKYEIRLNLIGTLEGLNLILDSLRALKE